MLNRERLHDYETPMDTDDASAGGARAHRQGARDVALPVLRPDPVTPPACSGFPRRYVENYALGRRRMRR